MAKEVTSLFVINAVSSVWIPWIGIIAQKHNSCDGTLK